MKLDKPEVKEHCIIDTCGDCGGQGQVMEVAQGLPYMEDCPHCMGKKRRSLRPEELDQLICGCDGAYDDGCPICTPNKRRTLELVA